RHRGPALLLDAVLELDAEHLACRSRGRGPWPWPRVLEAAAQAAGLLAGLRSDGISNRAVIAEYRDVVIHRGEHAGPVRVVARLDRRLLRFRRCRVEAYGAPGGELLLEGLVTLAPGA
ncbi:MAG TPA: hypothetical protein VJ814_01165, partial [Gaiellaceae bacterium]|nr:hypothetical protein [Gaiellaceae bacterium]